MKQDDLVKLLKEKNEFYSDPKIAQDKIDKIKNKLITSDHPIVSPLPSTQYAPTNRSNCVFAVNIPQQNNIKNLVLVIDQFGVISFFNKSADLIKNAPPCDKKQGSEFCNLLNLPSEALEKNTKTMVNTLNHLFFKANQYQPTSKEEESEVKSTPTKRG